MVILKPNNVVRLESYYEWECVKCKNTLQGFDSDLPFLAITPVGQRVYNYICPYCKQKLQIIEMGLRLLTKGEDCE